MRPFFQDKAPAEIKGFYSAEELTALAELQGTERDVEERMPVKMTRHFFDMAQHSEPLRRLVKASPDETLNLAGSEDPGFQMDYAPVEGMLHKYEMGLLYVVSTCSAHCRFCYREELISQKEIERQDGTVAKKGLAKIEARDRLHPGAQRDRCGQRRTPSQDRARKSSAKCCSQAAIRWWLPNRKIGQWLAALAEAGVESIRLGTKEMAFHPKRFDDAFLAMIDNFHETYPDVGFRLMIHFNHPDEFLLKGADGEYLENPNGSLKWHPDTKQAMEAVVSRGWINVGEPGADHQGDQR